MTELELIEKLNGLLSQIKISPDVEKEKLPSTYIIGCPRSGTTALLQYLSSTGIWVYPTNLITRFSSSPMIGLLVQKLLFSKSYGLINSEQEMSFSSDLGRSKGALNTNEFFHFFRRFFPNSDIRFLSDDELKEVNINELKKEIELLTSIDNKPFLSKGLMFQYNIEYFKNYFKDDLFIYIKRDPLYVMQSIYLARIKQFGSTTSWWSAKPREYAELKNKSDFEQIAGQVLYTEMEIENSLSSVSEDNKLIISYEEFVDSPQAFLEIIKEKYKKNGYLLSQENVISDKIFNGNIIKVDDGILSELKLAYNKLLKMRPEN